MAVTDLGTTGSGGGGPWRILEASGGADALHARDPWAAGRERAVWLCRPSRPALVLGSAQPFTDVDSGAAETEGVEVARRRSGGGAVLVVPGEIVWVDLALPAGDPLWEVDVGRASWWVGECWAEALGDFGVGPSSVHRGGMVGTPWSRRICFAGLGPGEVTAGGRKVVGLSQRRTRQGAVFHCAAFRRLDASGLVRLLALGPAEAGPAAAALAGAAAGLEELRGPGAPVASLEEALVARLP